MADEKIVWDEPKEKETIKWDKPAAPAKKDNLYTEGDVLYSPEGIPLYTAPHGKEVAGGTKVAQQLLTGVTSMPLRYGLSAAKPALGVAQMGSKLFESAPDVSLSDLVLDRKPQQNLSTIDELVKATGQIEKMTNQGAGPLSWATTRPASLAGDIFNPFTVGTGNIATSIASKALPNAPRWASTLGGGLGGGAMGLQQPVEPGLYGSDFWQAKANQAGAGTAFGAGAGYLFGKPVSEDITKLREAGVDRLTPGMMSPIMGKIEKFAERYIPFVGGPIRQAESRALEDFNKGAAQTVLSPLKVVVPPNVKPGHELNTFVKNTVGQAYDDIAQKISFDYSPMVKTEVSAELTNLAQGMSKKARKQFMEEANDALRNAASGGQNVSGRSFREMESNLGTKAMDYVSSKDAVDRTTGFALFKFQDFLRKKLQDQNPAVAAELKNIHQAFKNSLPYNKATTYAEAVKGVINPGMLRRSTKNMQGLDVLIRDFADSAVTVMGKRVIGPEGSTAAKVPGFIAEAAPIVGAVVPNPISAAVPGAEFAVPTAIAGMRSLYSKPGIAAANLFSKTPGTQIGTSTGNLAGGLSAYRMLQEREREALPPEY